MKYIKKDNIFISLMPKELNDVDFFINKKLETLKGKCFKEKGYILNIKSFEIFGNNKISNIDGSVIFNVNYEFEAFLPKIGNTYTVSVEYVYQEGIFTYINFVNILIPSSVLPDWVFIRNYFKNGDKRVKVKDYIEIEITTLKYDDNKYQCIGKFV